MVFSSQSPSYEPRRCTARVSRSQSLGNLAAIVEDNPDSDEEQEGYDEHASHAKHHNTILSSSPTPDALALYSPSTSRASSCSSSSPTSSTFSASSYALPSATLARARADLLHRLPWSRSASLLCSLPDTSKPGEIWRAPREFVPLHEMHRHWDAPSPTPSEEGGGTEGSVGEQATAEAEREENVVNLPHKLWRPRPSHMSEVETILPSDRSPSPIPPSASAFNEWKRDEMEHAISLALQEELIMRRGGECKSEELCGTGVEKERKSRFSVRRVLGVRSGKKPVHRTPVGLEEMGRSRSSWF